VSAGLPFAGAVLQSSFLSAFSLMMSGFNRVDALLGRFYHQVGNLVGLSLGLFAVAISLDLFLRLFGLGNLSGMQEIVEYALFAGVFLAAPWVLRLGAHVRVDLLLSGLPKKAASFLSQVLDLVGLLICVILVWFGSLNLSSAYAFNAMQMKYFNVPEWWLLSVFVVSFALLALEFVCRLLRCGDASEAGTDEAGGV
jgi:TRAP-type C4-dicarboxylate transport system permease small subunit